MQHTKKNFTPQNSKQNSYDDDNIPKIDLPENTDADNIIPDDVPRHDGPGGE